MSNQISITGDTYARLAAYAADKGVSIASVVEPLLQDLEVPEHLRPPALDYDLRASISAAYQAAREQRNAHARQAQHMAEWERLA